MVEGALVGGMGGDVVMEEEFAGRDGGEDVVGGGLVLCITELLVGCGSVLFRLAARVCGRWGSSWIGFHGIDDGGDECVVNHLIGLVGDVWVVVGNGWWWITWA